MENEDQDGKKDQLEEHSLPGTNQAGKGPGAPEKNEPEPRDASQQEDQLEEHALPGTNQAGKGPGSSEDHDQ